MRSQPPSARRGAAWARRAGSLLAGVLALWVGFACALRSGREACRVQPGHAATLLQPAVSNRAARLTMKLVRDLCPEAPVVPADAPLEALLRSAAQGRVLIVPDPARLPVSRWADLTAYLDAGGAALFIGCDPFEDRVGWRDGRLLTEAQLDASLLAGARVAEGFPSVQAWQHMNNSGALRGTVRIAEARDLPWPGVAVEVKGYDEWDVLAADGLATGLVLEAENSLVFYARGDAETPHLVAECEEDDGSRWAQAVTLTTAWRPHVLHEARFAYAWGGRDRGGAGDCLDLSRVRKISLGLTTYAALAPGDHTFGVSDVRLVADPRPASEVVAWPNVPLLSPPYRRHEFHASEIRSARNGERLFIGRTRMQSPLPRSRGLGGEAGAPYRWIPLFTAQDDAGRSLGAPVSLYVEPRESGMARRWGWIGIDVTRGSAEAIGLVVADCVERLHAGLFLVKAGCPQFAFEPTDLLEVSARWTPGTNPLPLRVAAELLRPHSGVPLRRVVAPASPAGGPVALNLGRPPAAGDQSEDLVIRVRLEGAEDQTLVVDSLDQPIKVLAPARGLTDRDWIGATASRFTLRGRPLFLLGVNYWPLTANGRSPGEYNPHWLNPGVFDPELVRRDLAQLEEAGINAISVQFHDEDEAPQLRFLADVARNYGIWVHVFVEGLHPFAMDLEKAGRLVKAAAFERTPELFAVDLAWEPRLGREQDRARLDPEWREWLKEQYGSVGHAEQVMGRALWRQNGRVTGPPDEELAKDGDHRAAVAVYRRFVHDAASRRYGQAVRALRRLGLRQLLSARSGFGGSGNPWANALFPLDLATGAAHFDYICPEGWGLFKGPGQFNEAGFITAYARGVSDGKPVAWLEFGSSVGPAPQPADLRNQARVYDNLFTLVIRSRAAACFAWWYPGGLRVDEKSDYGIVSPAGEWRPVGEVYRSFARRFRTEKGAVGPWRGREVDIAADARGLSALWDTWRDVYRRETADAAIEELRPTGFGKRTSEMAPLSVGGVPFADPAPLAFANAEWGRLEADGVERDRAPGRKVTLRGRQKLRIELINTGPATWDASQEGKPGSVWVAAEQEGSTRQLLTVRATPFGGRSWVEWLPPDTGTCRLRPRIEGLGGFGEALTLEILDTARPAR